MLTIPPPPCSTLFPYTTLFRSDHPGAFDEQSLFDGEDLGPDHPGRDRPPRQADHEDEPKEVDGSDSSGNHDHEDEPRNGDRKSTRLNSSHVKISYAVFCLKKKK